MQSNFEKCQQHTFFSTSKATEDWTEKVENDIYRELHPMKNLCPLQIWNIYQN